MSRQARQRRRRHNRAGPTRFLLIGGGMLVTALIVGAIAAVGYVLNVAAVGAARSTSLHPIIGGGSSQVYAADGTRLGFIQSDELRTPVALERNPGQSEERDGRDRGPALLQEQRRRPHGDLPRGGQGRHARQGAAGRLDDHDAAHAQPLPRRRPAHAQAEDHRGQAGDRLREAHTASTRSSPAISTASPTAPSAARRRSACRRRRGSSSTNRPRS